MNERPYSAQAGLDFIRNRLMQQGLLEGANQPAGDPPAQESEAQAAPRMEGRERVRQPNEYAASRSWDRSFLSIPRGGDAATAPPADQRAKPAAAPPGEEPAGPPRPGCRQRLGQLLDGVQPQPDAAVPGAPLAPAGMGLPGAPAARKDPGAPAQPEPKDSQRMEAVGGIDELNSTIGVAVSQGLSPRLMAELPVIQRELIQLAANLAFSAEEGQQAGVQKLEARQVARLEDLTDELSRELGPLEDRKSVV